MFLKRNKVAIYRLLIIPLVLVLISCGSYLTKEESFDAVARVGENYLYQEDINALLYEGVTKEDSVSLTASYINNWAAKQLLLSKSKVNLPEEKLNEFDALVSEYRADLYTRAYKDALINKAADTTVSKTEMQRFYENEKSNFRLKEVLVKIRFIQLPKRFLNKQTVIKKMKRFNDEDQVYLDSIGVHFKKLNFNDSIWVSATRVLEEIPSLNAQNQNKYLKKSQFFELEDAFGVYLAKVLDVRKVNDIAPLSFIEPTIKQVLLNRRKLDFIRNLETEIIDEAIKKNEFEIYTKDE